MRSAKTYALRVMLNLQETFNVHKTGRIWTANLKLLYPKTKFLIHEKLAVCFLIKKKYLKNYLIVQKDINGLATTIFVSVSPLPNRVGFPFNIKNGSFYSVLAKEIC